MKFKELVKRMEGTVSYKECVMTFYTQLKIGEMCIINKHITPEQFLKMSVEEREDLEINMTMKTILTATDDLVEWLEEKGFSGEDLEIMKNKLEQGNQVILKDLTSLPDDETEGQRRRRGKKNGKDR